MPSKFSALLKQHLARERHHKVQRRMLQLLTLLPASNPSFGMAPAQQADSSQAQTSHSHFLLAQCDESQLSDTQHAYAQHSNAQHSDAQHSDARHSDAQHSHGHRSGAQQSDAQLSDAQHSDAQQSGAQHSDAQHSDAQTAASQFSAKNAPIASSASLPPAYTAHSVSDQTEHQQDSCAQPAPDVHNPQHDHGQHQAHLSAAGSALIAYNQLFTTVVESSQPAVRQEGLHALGAAVHPVVVALHVFSNAGHSLTTEQQDQRQQQQQQQHQQKPQQYPQGLDSKQEQQQPLPQQQQQSQHPNCEQQQQQQQQQQDSNGSGLEQQLMQAVSGFMAIVQSSSDAQQSDDMRLSAVKALEASGRCERCSLNFLCFCQLAWLG